MTVWPQVVDWLTSTTKALWTDVLVLDGPETTGDSPLVYGTVGVSSASDNPGLFALVVSLDGYGVDEVGHVVAEIVANSGDEGFTGPRATAFAMFDDLYAQVSADQTLNGLLAVNATANAEAVPGYVTNKQGVAFSLALTLNYSTTSWPR